MRSILKGVPEAKRSRWTGRHLLLRIFCHLLFPGFPTKGFIELLPLIPLLLLKVFGGYMVIPILVLLLKAGIMIDLPYA